MNDLATVDQSFMPAITIQQAGQRYHAMKEFVISELKSGIDYGPIPGGDKPALLKPGAEKLCTFFGLRIPKPLIIESVKDWTGKDHGGQPFFYFEYCQELYRGDVCVAASIASANSWETKHRYRWVPEAEIPESQRAGLKSRSSAVTEFDFAITKAETTGKWGKPIEYWRKFQEAIQNGTAKKVKKKKRDNTESEAWEIGGVSYRVPNPDIADVVNTLQKMAHKRALVGACLIATNASEFFTQDMEDLEQEVAEYHPDVTTEKASKTEPKSDPTKAPETKSSPAGTETNGGSKVDARLPPALQLAQKLGWSGDKLSDFLMAKFGIKSFKELNAPQKEDLHHLLEKELNGVTEVLISDEEFDELQALADSAQTDVSKVLAHFDILSMSFLPKSKLAEAVKIIKKFSMGQQ